MDNNLSKKKEFDNCAIIIQARMSSSRFPGKMMSRLYDMPLLEFVYRRCRESSVEKVLIATSDDKLDDLLYNYCKNNNIPVMRGSLHDVLERYIEIAVTIGVECIVRVCGDTPFVDIFLIDIMLSSLIYGKLDYVSLDRETCHSGFSSEVVSLQALKKVDASTNTKEDLENVTRYIINNPQNFLMRFIKTDLNPGFVRNVRLTVDYPEDIENAKAIASELSGNFSFTSQRILNIVNSKLIKR